MIEFLTKESTKVSIDLEPYHRFHSYCARFPSEVAESAISAYSKPGDSVSDPFCGSGTTLVAGLALKRRVVGSDIDVLAGMISELKCAARPTPHYQQWQKRFERKLRDVFRDIESGWSDALTLRAGEEISFPSIQFKLPTLPIIEYWFPPRLRAALAAISKAAHECHDPHFENVALVTLSAAVIAKWPNSLSYAMDIDHTRPHRRIRRFQLTKVLETYLKRLDRTITCLGSLGETFQEIGIQENSSDLYRVICPHDARKPLSSVSDESQTLIVTSPPYFNAVDYPRAHRLSVCWMNGRAPADLTSRSKYIGLHQAPGFDAIAWLDDRSEVRNLLPPVVIEQPMIRRRLAAFYADLETVLKEIHRQLRPGGYAVFVIGDNVIKGNRIASHSALVQIAQSLGFTKKAVDSREIGGMRRRYPVGQFGFDGPLTHEFVVVLQKPKEKREIHA